MKKQKIQRVKIRRERELQVARQRQRQRHSEKRTKRNVKRGHVARRQDQEHADLRGGDGRHDIGERVSGRLPVHYVENAAVNKTMHMLTCRQAKKWIENH